MDKLRIRRILSLSIPIVGGMLSQNILNLVDIFFVKSLGDAALAASGIGGFASFAAISLVLGISTGVQATASRRKGEGRHDELARPLNTGLLLALFMGSALTFLLYLVVPYGYPYLNSDPEVIAVGAEYLQIRIIGAVFVGLNFAFRGYWNAIDLSKVYLTALLVMHIANIILNYLLIFGNFGFPEMGLAGAAWGTTLSLIIGTGIYFFQGFRLASDNGFLQTRPSKREIIDLLKLSMPSSTQQLFFASGLLALYWIVGKIGTTELAAANILTNVMLVAILPGMGLGLGAATLVGQALGRQDPTDAKAWGWDVCKVGGVIVFLIGLPMWAIPDIVLLPFSPDADTTALALLPLQITGAYIIIDIFGLILMHSLLGAGAASTVMKVSLSLQWFLFLPAAYLAVTLFQAPFLVVWLMQACYRGGQSVVFAWLWKRGHWAKIVI